MFAYNKPIEKDEIVVGSTLSALIYSYYKNLPFIHVDLGTPSHCDLFFDQSFINKLNFYGLTKSICNQDRKKIDVVSKVVLWNKIYYLLNLCSLRLTPSRADFLSLRNKDVLEVNSVDGNTYLFRFNRLNIFDLHKFYNLPDEVYKHSFKNYECRDIFETRIYSNDQTAHVYLNINDPYIKNATILDYGYRTKAGHLMTNSFLPYEMLDSTDNHNLVIRNKVNIFFRQKALENGYRAAREYFSMSVSSVKHLKRLLFSKDENKVLEFGNISVNYSSDEDLIDNICLPIKSKPYVLYCLLKKYERKYRGKGNIIQR